MYLMGIDFNINSLPVAAIGIGIGIDYGYYVLSRIVEEYEVDARLRRGEPPRPRPPPARRSCSPA